MDGEKSGKRSVKKLKERLKKGTNCALIVQIQYMIMLLINEKKMMMMANVKECQGEGFSRAPAPISPFN
jgi:hypothetical protein